jgi:DNA polymerase III epsilon subunit-like protein
VNTPVNFKRIADLVRRLNKPMTVFDLEGTGFRGPRFGITEVGAFSILPDGRSFLYGGLVNPEFPITPQARDVTGITQSMVRDKENWGLKYAQHFDKISREHIISGFNLKTFDIPAVIEQNARYGVTTPPFGAVVDVRRFYLEANGLKKQTGKLVDVATAYGVTEKGDAHRAMSDAIMTVELLEALLEAHGEDNFMSLLNDTGKKSRSRATAEVNLVDDIAAHIQVRGFSSLEALAISLGVQVSELEFPLCKGVDSGVLDAFLFAHGPTRTWLKSAIPSLFAQREPFDGKMKPLLEALTLLQPSGVQLGYLQMRIGLLDAGYTWGSVQPLKLAA